VRWPAGILGNSRWLDNAVYHQVTVVKEMIVYIVDSHTARDIALPVVASLVQVVEIHLR
jgi:hypothetical protein